MEKVVALVGEHGLVHVAQVAAAVGVARSEAEKTMEAAAVAESLRLLFIASTDDANGVKSVVCESRASAEKVTENWGNGGVSIYAVGARDPNPQKPSSAPPSFVFKPSRGVRVRDYPLAKRTGLEMSAAAQSCTPTEKKHAAPPPPAAAAAAASVPIKKESLPPKVATPIKKEAPEMEAPPLPTASPLPVHAPPPPPAAVATPAAQPAQVSSPVDTTKEAEISKATIPNAAVPSPQPVVKQPGQQTSLFDMMKAAAKRPREQKPTEKKAAPPSADAAASSKAPPKPKKAKVENTTSLAKLAKASAKKKGAAAEAPGKVIAHANILDEEPEESSSSSDEESISISYEEVNMHAEEAVLDVEVTAEANDDIIICDDAPPLAFMAPEPHQAEPAATPAAAAGGRLPSTVSGASQPTLGSFFSPAVVKFQQSFKKEMRTETKLLDGEYICADVLCYRSLVDGCIISEEEYHRRCAELVAAKGCTPSHSNGAGSDLSPQTPAAAPKKQARPSVSKQAKKEAPVAGKSLLSFFGK